MFARVILPALLGCCLLIGSSLGLCDVLGGVFSSYCLNGDVFLLCIGLQIAGALLCGCAIANVVSGDFDSKKED